MTNVGACTTGRKGGRLTKNSSDYFEKKAILACSNLSGDAWLSLLTGEAGVVAVGISFDLSMDGPPFEAGK